MKLKTYLKREKISQKAFAAKIGCTRVTINNYILGKRTPALVIAYDIVRATKGAVTLRDLLDGAAETIRAGAVKHPRIRGIDDQRVQAVIKR